MRIGRSGALALCLAGVTGAAHAQAPGAARFDWFAYQGLDPVHDVAVGEDEFLNPILAGFYPDPSITRAGDDYYLVHSTFTYFPGIPVFHSRDLVNWTQIGNAIDRPDMLDFSGLRLSRGVFAPTIEHQDGLFYIANTCVDCGGNFIITAEDPAGPWSDPVWLPEVGGIDPSLFFDADGTVWLMNNDVPPGGSTYDGHRAIWIRRIDPETFQSVSEPVAIVDGGARPEDKPIWIEGPHIYRLGEGDYLLSTAEGGTSVDHSQVVFRAAAPDGPWTPYEGNPILTQRHLDPDRPSPVTSTGHADYVELPDGSWWATFLATRPYEGNHYNTGRETFLLPVRWTDDGWPVLLEDDEEVPYVLQRPNLEPAPGDGPPMTGPIQVREDFDAAPGPEWLRIKNADGAWSAVEDGALTLQARAEPLGGEGQPSFLARRQQHKHASAETQVRFAPQGPEDAAGLAAFQDQFHYYLLAVGAGADGPEVRLMRRQGEDEAETGVQIAAAPLEAADAPVDLRITARADAYDFAYRTEGGDWTVLAEGLDGRLLSTQTAGGFVGAVLGLYAYSPEG